MNPPPTIQKRIILSLLLLVRFRVVPVLLLSGISCPRASADQPAGRGEWGDVLSTQDPTAPLLEKFRKAPSLTRPWTPTGLGRADYLKLIAGEVDFWKGRQIASGAIIDPFANKEIQYSTPAFAYAAAALVAWNGRRDLIDPAARALDWSVRQLSQRKAASSHEDFYPPLIAHAMALLKPRVPAERFQRWEAGIRGFDPRKTYRQAPGSMNWNIVSSCGEASFQAMGLRRDGRYVEVSLGAQGRHFTSPFGLYVEGPMAYDLFPRMFLDDLLASGYGGPYCKELEEMLRRGALASLFMQSPWGELPAGGRSAHHQWNEAEQCAVFEMHAAKASRAGDAALAGAFKRAAHLAFRSMKRWVRPTGEMQIVKNWVTPEKRHGYEGYSTHSQYNLLPASMLALACQYAEGTETTAEKPAPAEVGGFVFEVPALHKVFANAGGTYVEIDTLADPHYDATGLIRVHDVSVSPQIGPSDSVLAKPAYNAEDGTHPPVNTGVGVSWRDAMGQWRRIGELGGDEITRTSLTEERVSPNEVSFAVVYEGNLFGTSRITENYKVTSGRVELTTRLDGYTGPLRYVWPLLADDGRTKTSVDLADRTVTVSQDGGRTAQTFSAPGAEKVSAEPELFPNHNGWARLGVAEFAKTDKVTLIIAPRSAFR